MAACSRWYNVNKKHYGVSNSKLGQMFNGVGEGWDTWAVDGLVLHSTTPLGAILTSNFQNMNVNNDWLTWFGGQIQTFCSRYIIFIRIRLHIFNKFLTRY